MQRVLAAALLLLAVSGCVIVGDPTCSGAGAAVVITPGVVIVAVGESFTPNASDSWCDGGHQSHGSPNWSFSRPGDSLYVSLNQSTGRITGLHTGVVTVLARSDHSDATSSIQVMVR
ncbi:MAG TPA: hypothetical protein VGH98_21755 [Gemmatimonadaceae bacterium]